MMKKIIKNINIMKNLAGVDNCDTSIREELYLASIEVIPLDTKGEVPFTIAGRIGNWKLTRAWNYWVVSVEIHSDGLPLKDAMELHNKPNPIDDTQHLGQTIRSGGHCGCPSPDEYGADPIYDEKLNEKLLALGYKEKELCGNKYVDISVGEISKLNQEGKIDVPFYVSNYHIDDQIGLNEFAKALKEYYKSNRLYTEKINIDEDTELFPVSVWNNIVDSGMFGNYDGSGYWMKDGKKSNDEALNTLPLDATHVIWYSK